MKKIRYKDIPAEKIHEIQQLFLTENDNRITRICELTGFSYGMVRKAIEQYFDDKKKAKQTNPEEI